MQRLLQWIGILAVLGVAGAGVVAWALVRDRLQITVSDGATRVADDPVLLLGDDVRALRADMQSLTSTLSRHLRSLGDELVGSQEAERERQQGIERERVTAIRRVEAAIETLRADVAGIGTPIAASAASPAATPVPSSPEPKPIEPPMHAVAETGETSPATVSSRRRSSFAFEIPTATFAFDVLQDFEILPALSRVGFDAKSTLHDFTGVTSSVRGVVHANLAAPATATATIDVDVKALDTGLVDRNTAMLEHLGAEAHPRIAFELTGFTPSSIDAPTRSLRGDGRGRMTIRGKTREVTMPIRAHVDDGLRLVIEGEMALKLSDYEIPVPSQLGLIRMQDEVRVWIALRARAWKGGRMIWGTRLRSATTTARSAILVLCVLPACIPSNVVAEKDRAVHVSQDGLVFVPATAADLDGLFASVEITGPAALSLQRVWYWFGPDGSYSGAALLRTIERSTFQTLGGSCSLRDGRLRFDADGPASIVELAGEYLRIRGDDGCLLLRREELR